MKPYTTLAEAHLLNLDGVCTTHQGCSKGVYVNTKKKEDSPAKLLSMVDNLLKRNKELMMENVRCNQRNKRQAEYIQKLQEEMAEWDDDGPAGEVLEGMA